MKDNQHHYVEPKPVATEEEFQNGQVYDGFILSLPDIPEYIRVEPNGDFFFKGKKIVNDVEVYILMREYFSLAKKYRNANNMN